MGVVRRTAKILVALAALGLGVGVVSTAGHTQTAPEPEGAVRVAIKPAPPFVQDEAEPRGFSIDLWDEIAERTEIRSEFAWVETVSEQLDAVETNRADAAIAAISITEEREQTVDFTHPVYDSGLQLLVRDDQGLTIGDNLRSIVSTPVLRLLLAMFVGVGIVGCLVWLIERRTNDDFHDRAHLGVWDGMWWAIVTLMTVGYGDRVPRSAAGRILSITWMVIGVIFIANFTAVVTAQLTVTELSKNVVAVREIDAGRLGTIANTTSSAYVAEEGLRAESFPTVNDAVTALENDEIDGLVYDAPILRYIASSSGKGRVRTTGPVFEPEYYGIALPEGSPLLEPVNAAILSIIDDGTYEALQRRWFGEDDA
jgi:polar amino acid transport system substrate-binding protein